MKFGGGYISYIPTIKIVPRLCQAHEAQREVEEAAFQEPEEPEEPPQPLRVWVLMGGDGVGRHISMASGLHVFRQLHAQADLQVGACVVSRVCDMWRRRRSGFAMICT